MWELIYSTQDASVTSVFFPNFTQSSTGRLPTPSPGEHPYASGQAYFSPANRQHRQAPLTDLFSNHPGTNQMACRRFRNAHGWQAPETVGSSFCLRILVWCELLLWPRPLLNIEPCSPLSNTTGGRLVALRLLDGTCKLYTFVSSPSQFHHARFVRPQTFANLHSSLLSLPGAAVTTAVSSIALWKIPRCWYGQSLVYTHHVPVGVAPLGPCGQHQGWCCSSTRCLDHPSRDSLHDLHQPLHRDGKWHDIRRDTYPLGADHDNRFDDYHFNNH